jgi:glycosyltransferase involved in cell wall biosynthesis
LKKLFLFRLYKHSPIAFIAVVIFILLYLFFSYKKMDMIIFPYNDMFSSEIQNSKSRYLVCTATITERKRVVELAEAAIIAQVPVWIIGEPYSKKDRYYEKFLSVVRAAGEMVRYEGGISSREEMASIYQNASGFVLLSSMESLSLSALEAAAGGCALLLADLPWARFSFGSQATYSRLGSKEEEAGNLKNFYHRIDEAPKPHEPCRWEDVGKQLCRIYEGLLLADKTSR